MADVSGGGGPIKRGGNDVEGEEASAPDILSPRRAWAGIAVIALVVAASVGVGALIGSLAHHHQVHNKSGSAVLKRDDVPALTFKKLELPFAQVSATFPLANP